MVLIEESIKMLNKKSNHHQNYSRCKTKKLTRCPSSTTNNSYNNHPMSLQAVILYNVAILYLVTMHNVFVHCDPFRSLMQPQQSQISQLSAGSSNSNNNNNQMMIRDLSGPTSGKIQSLDVICGKNFMTVRAEFSGPFYGLVFSKGTYGHENCIYVKPNSGLTHAAFNVYYDQCGTKPDLQGKFYENTIVIQYGSDIIEAYDEAKRLRCEWFEAYEKPATFKPAIPVADLEVVEMNFQGDDIDCWMEIQEGTGPWSREVSKIVPVGQPMTIVVAINDYNGQFDMRVKSCVAHDGVQTPIALTDEYGCVLRPKMLTPFVKIKNPGAHKEATILSYSRFLAFKFPDSMNVQIQCTVEVCRNGCAEACQRVPSSSATTLQTGELSVGTKWPGSAHQPSMAVVGGHSLPSRDRPAPFGTAAASPPAVISMEPDMANESQPKPSHADFQGRQVQPATTNVENHDQNKDLNHGNYGDMAGSQSMPQPSHANPNLVPQHYGGFNRAHPDMIVPPRFADSRRVVPPSFQQSHQQHRQTQPKSYTETTTQAPEEPKVVNTSFEPSSARGEESLPDVNASGDADTVHNASGSDQSSEQQPESIRLSGPVSDQSTTSNKEQSINSNENKEAKTTNEQNINKESKSSSSSGDSSPSPPTDSKSTTFSVASQDDIDQPSAVYVNSDQAATNTGASSSSEPKPQDPDMMQAAASNSQPQQVSQSTATPKLAPVEVEIPTNSETADQYTPISSSVDRLPDIPNASYEPAMISIGNQQNYNRNQQNKQQADRRNDQSSSKNNDDNQMDDLMISHKGPQFGVRSPPTQKSAVESPSQNPAESTNVAQDSSLANANADAPIESLVPSDRILMDRSDDAGVSIETIPSEPLKAPSPYQQDQSSAIVGNDDLNKQSSSSSQHIEDRMGSVSQQSSIANVSSNLAMQNQASSTLEEEVAKLQHQIPQSAALVSLQTNQQSDIGLTGRNELSQPVDETKQAIDSQQQPGANERADKSPNSRPSISVRDLRQPFPNVVGQSKIISDPATSQLVAAAREQSIMQMQSSNVDPTVVMAPHPVLQQQTMKPNNNVESKPEAQITNVPLNIAFPPKQLPTIQQLSQQFAYMQQHQQQQLQQQNQQKNNQAPTSTPAPKPSRMRFNLLSPQAALQAVASRLLPKTFMQQQHQYPDNKQQQQALGQMVAANNLAGGQFQQQQAQLHNGQTNQNQYQPQFTLDKAGHMAKPQQHLSNSPSVPMAVYQPSIIHGNNNNNPNNMPQAPLVRSRRSAMQPTPGTKGSGEVGVRKGFMVVTGLDLAFAPNSTATKDPQILEGRRIDDEPEILYGVCMSVVSLTFILTCVFWSIVFLSIFCIYCLIKSFRQRSLQRGQADSEKINYVY